MLGAGLWGASLVAVACTFNPADPSNPDAPLSAVCGDGLRARAEACDDGNARPGDGCSETCTVEVGWRCDTGANGDRCVRAGLQARDDTFVRTDRSPAELDVLANDVAASAGPLVVESVGTTTIGQAVLDGPVGAATRIRFTPNATATGGRFTYVARNDLGQTDDAVVTLVLPPPNRAPTANDIVVVTTPDDPVLIQLTGQDPDGDPLTFRIVQPPARGTVTEEGGGRVTYDGPGRGRDAFSFVANDGLVDSDTATVTISYSRLADWWNEQWSHRQRIDVLYSGPALVDVPILVALDREVADIDTFAQDASDVRFVDNPDGNELTFEIEDWNPDGLSLVWVRLPELTGDFEEDAFWMYYGNPTTTTTEDPSAVWSSAGYVGVWHFAGNLIDSVAGQAAAEQGATYTSTPWGTGVSFNGQSVVDLPNGLIGTGEGSACLVFQSSVTQISDHAMLFYGTSDSAGLRNGFGPDLEFHLMIQNSDNTRDQLGMYMVGLPRPLVANALVLDRDWHHACASWAQGQQVRLYLDGIRVDDLPHTGTQFDASFALRIGAPVHPSRRFQGWIDEVRIHPLVQPDAWFDVQYRSLEDSLIEFQPEEVR